MIETPVESLDPQVATDGTSFEVIADYTDGLMQMDADGCKCIQMCANKTIACNCMQMQGRQRQIQRQRQ